MVEPHRALCGRKWRNGGVQGRWNWRAKPPAHFQNIFNRRSLKIKFWHRHQTNPKDHFLEKSQNEPTAARRPPGMVFSSWRETCSNGGGGARTCYRRGTCLGSLRPHSLEVNYFQRFFFFGVSTWLKNRRADKLARVASSAPHLRPRDSWCDEGRPCCVS